MLAGVIGLTVGCGDDTTGDPGVPDADFRPRLVITAGEAGLRASVGERGEGDARVSDDPARLPTGSVIEIRVEGPDDQRVVGTLTPPGAAPVDLDDRSATTPQPLVDTGLQQPGDAVTVVLTQPGTLELHEVSSPGDRLAVEVSAR